jgi:hypothetical protein
MQVSSEGSKSPKNDVKIVWSEWSEVTVMTMAIEMTSMTKTAMRRPERAGTGAGMH